jgi:hypothetical protein
MICAGHVARPGLLWGKPEGDYLEDLDVDGKILLTWISRK